MEITAVAAKAEKAERILDRCVCLILRTRCLGNTRQVDMTDVDLHVRGQEVQQAAKRELTMTKLLVRREVLTPATQVIESAKAFLRSVSTSGYRVFGPTTYLIAHDSVGRVETRLKDDQARLEEVATAVAAHWAEIVKQRRKDLGPNFSPQDYCTAAEVRSKFAIDWSYLSFEATDRLETVDRAVVDGIAADERARLSRAFDEVVVGLRLSALKVVRELANRLSLDAAGNPKVLRPTALRDLEEFVKWLPERNSVGEDSQLAQIMAKLKGEADKVDLKGLRKETQMRERLLAEAEQAIQHLDGLIESEGRTLAMGGF